MTGKGAFEAVFDHGIRHEGRYVQIVIAPAARNEGRAGFVVGRKALPRAVDRNRLKRLCREMLRAKRDSIAHLDIILRLKRAIGAEAVRDAAAEAGALVDEAIATARPPIVRS